MTKKNRGFLRFLKSSNASRFTRVVPFLQRGKIQENFQTVVLFPRELGVVGRFGKFENVSIRL